MVVIWLTINHCYAHYQLENPELDVTRMVPAVDYTLASCVITRKSTPHTTLKFSPYEALFGRPSSLVARSYLFVKGQ